MFGFGMPQILIVLAIALIVIGPQKLPELARTLGKGLKEFKRASNDFRRSIEEDERVEEEKKRLMNEDVAEESAEVLETRKTAAGEVCGPA